MTEIRPSEMKEAKRIPKTNFSFLLLEHLTETLDGIEIGKVLQGYTNLRRIKVEEFTQHKYARMWRLRRTSGKGLSMQEL